MAFEKEATCIICGKSFTRGKYQAAQKCCSKECSAESISLQKKKYYELNKETINRRSNECKKNKKREAVRKKYSHKREIVDISVLARKEGLSYGQYVAKYGL